jgi:AcrR family transcriptional regulator
MKVRETGTEQLIKDTAKRVFFAEGRLHASTQDIADAAGISRTSLHYYFRSRDELMRQVFNEALQKLDSKLYVVMDSSISFANKIEKMTEVYLEEMIVFPYTEIFLVTEMISKNSKLFNIAEKGTSHIQSFIDEIEAEMNAGNITKMDPIHYLLNLFSLTAYPLVISPLHKQLFNLSNEEYHKKILERKRIIVDIMLR